MKSKFLLPFLLLFIISCSDDSYLIDENEGLIDDTEILEFRQNEIQTPTIPNDTNTDAESASFGINWCINKCSLERKDCFDWASENRYYSLLDCEDIRIIGVEVVDIFCEETVIVGYDQVEVYSPEGELIRIDEVPIYGIELVLCGQEEQNIYSTDPAVLQAYEDCRNQAQIDFIDAIDDCDIKYIQCEQKCKKPKPNQNDPV